MWPALYGALTVIDKYGIGRGTIVQFQRKQNNIANATI